MLHSAGNAVGILPVVGGVGVGLQQAGAGLSTGGVASLPGAGGAIVSVVSGLQQVASVSAAGLPVLQGPGGTPPLIGIAAVSPTAAQGTLLGVNVASGGALVSLTPGTGLTAPGAGLAAVTAPVTAALSTTLAGTPLAPVVASLPTSVNGSVATLTAPVTAVLSNVGGAPLLSAPINATPVLAPVISAPVVAAPSIGAPVTAVIASVTAPVTVAAPVIAAVTAPVTVITPAVAAVGAVLGVPSVAATGAPPTSVGGLHLGGLLH